MALLPKKTLLDKLLWSWKPESDREAGHAIVSNFLLHWFPNRVLLKSIAYNYSFYLGTICFTLFMILSVTGAILMFFYTPSVERAYWSIKDIDFVVSFGWFLRRSHRVSAHLMVIAVFLHMFRVFLTGAYKRGTSAGSSREFNWILGVVLFVLTLMLSFTGYLLPWDQLAYWAITVGTNIAASVPLIGNQIRYLMVGGNEIGQNTLIRFYVLHIVVLPAMLLAVSIWHMWRIRKDGGLAISEQERARVKEMKPSQPTKTKTYSLMGVSSGTTVQVFDPTTVNEEKSVPSSPNLVIRILLIVLATCAVTAILSAIFQAPLEEAANPRVTPNPAKAPWYFLGLQELVGYSALIGGVILPGVVVTWLGLIPFIDREKKDIGVWFFRTPELKWAIFGGLYGLIATVAALLLGVLAPMRSLFPTIESQIFFDLVNPATLLFVLVVALYFIVWKLSSSSRYATSATFCAFIICFILLTYTGMALRGPNWDFFWPWQAWPQHPIPF